MDVLTAKKIPIDLFLQQLGFPVASIARGQKWYRAPTRNENTPSFKLSPDAFAWFDHATGEGGNILDLAFRLQTNRTLTGRLDGQQLSQALAYLEQVMGSQPQPTRQRIIPQSIVSAPAFTLVDHKPFVALDPQQRLTPAARYLSSRGINPTCVAPYLQEVTFRGTDNRHRSGFGLSNVVGGYELRRSGDWAKMAIGPKDVTIFQAQRPAAPWHTFYSLIDFCTYLTVDQPPLGAYHYLIINSDSLVGKAAHYLEPMPAGFMVHYPHTDPSGQRAYHQLRDITQQQGWQVTDRSPLYAGFKDWTEAREQQLGLNQSTH